MDFSERNQSGEIQFPSDINPTIRWNQTLLPQDFFIELDCYSEVDPSQTVIQRLVSHLYPSARIRKAGTGFVFTNPPSWIIPFKDGRELLCKLSTKDGTLNVLTVSKAIFQLREYRALDTLVERFPPIVLTQYTSPQAVQEQLNVESGDACRITCTVLSKPSPLIFWCFSSRIRSNKRAGLRSDHMIHQGWLEIDPCSSDDEGSYYCCVLSNTALSYFNRLPSYCLQCVSSPSLPEKLLPPPPILSSETLCKVTSKFGLLIGNSRFDHYKRLSDSMSTLNEMACALRKLDFQVLVLLDLNHDEMLRVISVYEQLLSPGTYGFFYIASHGVRIREQDFALATDASEVSWADMNRNPKSDDPTKNLQPHGFISIEAITCRLQARDPSMNVMVVDTCRQEMGSTGEPDREPSTLDAVARLNHYTYSNLFRLYACQPGSLAFEAERSILSCVLIDCLDAYASHSIAEFLNTVCLTYSTVLKGLNEKFKSTGYALKDPKVFRAFISQKLDLNFPAQLREHTSAEDQVVRYYVNTLPANANSPGSDILTDTDQRMSLRTLADKIGTTENKDPGAVSDIRVQWSACNQMSLSEAKNDVSAMLNLDMERNSIIPYRSVARKVARQWISLTFLAGNVLQLTASLNPRSHLPTAYFRLDELRQAWKPCRVECGKHPSDEVAGLPGHYSTFIIRDIQRRLVLYGGNDRIAFNLHRFSQQAVRSTRPYGGKCGCTKIQMFIDCPPVIKLWHLIDTEI